MADFSWTRAWLSLKDVAAGAGRWWAALLRLGLVIALVVGIPAVDIWTQWGPDLAVPWRIAWAASVLTAFLVGAQAVYGHRRDLDTLRDRVKTAARMTPAIWGRIQRIKETIGQISSRIQHQSPIDRPTAERLLDELMELGSQTGEHHSARSAATLYAAWANTLFRALDRSPDDEARRKLRNDSLIEDHKMFTFAMQLCNRVLEQYPMPPVAPPPSKSGS